MLVEVVCRFASLVQGSWYSLTSLGKNMETEKRDNNKGPLILSLRE
jgi:hypothetical protein